MTSVHVRQLSLTGPRPLGKHLPLCLEHLRRGRRQRGYPFQLRRSLSFVGLRISLQMANDFLEKSLHLNNALVHVSLIHKLAL